MDEKDKLKPLPKPVVAPFHREKSNKSNKPIPPVSPVDPDNFELPEHEPRPNRNTRTALGREPIRGKWLSEKEPPSFGTAVAIFFKRLWKKIIKSINEIRQTRIGRVPEQQGLQSGQLHGAGQRKNQQGSQAGPPRETKRQARMRKRRRQVYARLTGIAAAGIFVIALFVFLIIWLTGKNAYEITLGEETIGYVALSEDMTAEKIQAQAVSHLETTLGAKVQVDNQVKIEEVNVSRSKIEEDEKIIDLVGRNFTYKIAATAIIVGGQEIAVLKTYDEAVSVEKKLQEPYTSEFTVSAKFIEDFKYETRYVGADGFDTTEDALIQLDKSTRTLEDYVIKEGDTLDSIAKQNGTTVNEICANTPGLTVTTVLHPGDAIKMETTRPYLSVRTIDEVVREEIIPMQTETQPLPTQTKSYTNVVQEGREGLEEVTYRRTCVNGVLEKPEEEVNRKTVVAAETRIVEVGTLEIAPR